MGLAAVLFIWWAGVLLASLGIISFLDAKGAVRAPEYIGVVLELYREALHKLAWLDFFVRPIIAWLGNCFGINLVLPPDWKDLLVPIMLYCTNNVKANLNVDQGLIDRKAYRGPNESIDLRALKKRSDARIKGRRIYAIFLLGWGALVSLAICVSYGVASREPGLGALVAALFGFLFYELGSLLAVSILVGYEGESWMQSFNFKFRQRFVTNMALAAVVIAAGAIVHLAYLPNRAISAYPLFLLLYIALAAARDVGASMSIIAADSSQDEFMKFYNKVSQLATFKLGRDVLAAIASTIMVFVPKIIYLVGKSL